MAEPIWMLGTNVLSDLIRNPRGVLVQRLSVDHLETNDLPFDGTNASLNDQNCPVDR